MFNRTAADPPYTSQKWSPSFGMCGRMKSRWLNFPPYHPNAISFREPEEVIRLPVPVAFTTGVASPIRGAFVGFVVLTDDVCFFMSYTHGSFSV